MKICNECRLSKPIDQFFKDATRPDGFAYRCKPCHKLLIRKRVVRADYKTGPKPKALVERFWPKVKKGKSPQDCWSWLGSKQTSGYGKMSRRSGSWDHASRVSWTIHYGDIPDGLWVLHKCDNPECTNPDHLFLGTHLDNMRDMLAKGRGR